MSMDGDDYVVGWAGLHRPGGEDDDDDGSSSSAYFAPPATLSRTTAAPRQHPGDDDHGYAAKYAVVGGQVVLSPSSSRPSSLHRRRRSDSSYGASDGGGTLAAARIIHNNSSGSSDRIPSKPLRTSSSERRTLNKQGKESAASRWRCDPHRPGPPNTGPPDLSRKCSGDASSSTHHPVIEVAPGINLRLRGSQETWRAIARDYYVPGLCWGCSETIFVIQDAAYVLCPACRTVSPMEGTFENPDIAGVGLGFTFEELVTWQQQIADERDRNLYN